MLRLCSCVAASSVAASEDMREYDATMEELYLASADDSSEESIPSMLPVQSTSSAMASAGTHSALHPLTHVQFAM